MGTLKHPRVSKYRGIGGGLRGPRKDYEPGRFYRTWSGLFFDRPVNPPEKAKHPGEVLRDLLEML